MTIANLKRTFARKRANVMWVAGGSAAAVTLALLASTTANAVQTTPASGAGLAIFVALAVAVPLLSLCAHSGSKINLLHRENQRLRQRDVLTSCLNGATFSALVDTYSERRTVDYSSTRGTVLLLNLDDIRVVNERFGYSWGNEALAHVAEVIRSSVRQGDIVGRLSGGQFGVFLPYTDQANAKAVADRIHENIESSGFYPTGIHYPLSVRAGAVTVANQIGFDDLLRRAVDSLAAVGNGDDEWINFTSMDDRSTAIQRTLQ